MTTTAQADFITSLRNTDLLTARDAYQWSTAEASALIDQLKAGINIYPTVHALGGYPGIDPEDVAAIRAHA